MAAPLVPLVFADASKCNTGNISFGLLAFNTLIPHVGASSGVARMDVVDSPGDKNVLGV